MLKRTHIRVLSLLLVLSVMLSAMPAASAVAAQQEEPVASEAQRDPVPETEPLVLDEKSVPDIVGLEVARERDHVLRMHEEELGQLNKLVFLNADGSRTMYLYDHPVKYVDEDGAVRDISLEIADTGDASNPFRTASGAAVTTFSANLSGGITLSGNSANIRLVPETGSRARPASRLDSKTIQYPYGTYTTIEYSLTYTGFKEDIVVSQYTGQTEYPFMLYTNGLTLTEIDGSWYLTDENGDIQATIGDIIVFTADERNNTMGALRAETVVPNQEYRMTIVLDPEYLADPDTVYPIRIDPTIDLNYEDDGATAIEDVTINSADGSSFNSSSLFVGQRGERGISRILMRFPGLASEIAGIGTAVVTSATVEMRDVLCESSSMTVNCYLYTGSAWGSGSTWATLDQATGALLDYCTIDYDIGVEFETKHRYSFDITDAVQAWFDGSHDLNKGIIFQANSAVENGTTSNYRTFASFNRSNYKPSLVVEYEEPDDDPFPTGEYYINNFYHGKFLRMGTNGAYASAGTTASLGDSAKWSIRPVGGGYVICCDSDPLKVLSVPTSTSSSAVTITTVSQGVLPQRCIWTITRGAFGHYLIKNTYNGRYLTYNGSNIQTASNINANTTAYNSAVWRMQATSTYVELPSNFSFSNLQVNVGSTVSPRIATNAHWSSASDFTYTLSSEHAGKREGANQFVGISYGTANVTATHKVTGRVTTFTITVKKLLIYQTLATYYLNEDGEPSEDMMCGDISRAELTELDWVNWTDFLLTTIDGHKTELENAATLYSNGSLRPVALEMVAHFLSGSGTPYAHVSLTTAVREHNSTRGYVQGVEQYLDTLLTMYCDDLNMLAYSAETRTEHPLVQMMSGNLNNPVYNTIEDHGNGLVFCIHSLHGAKIEIEQFSISGNTYTYTLTFTLYDHFGLDQADVERYGYLPGFVSWYVLQHYEEYNGTFRPFLTLVEFSETFTGEL